MSTLSGPLYTLAVIGSVIDTAGKSRPIVHSWTYHLLTAAGPLAPVSWVIDAFHSLVWTQVAARISNEYRGSDVLAYSDPWVLPPPDFSGYKPADGQNPGARLPLHICVAVTLRTDSRGHQYVGRKRIGPILQAEAVGTGLTADALSAWQGIAQRFTQQLQLPNGEVWEPVVLSRLYSTRGSPPIYVGARLVEGNVSPLVGLCRHRREKTQQQAPGPVHGWFSD